MKKLSSLLLLLVIIFSLCGCIQETTDTAIVTAEEFITVEKPPIVVEEEKNQAEETKPLSPTVYRTKTGEKYHRSSCLHLKSKIETTVEDAQSMGLKPCSVCQPPQ